MRNWILWAMVVLVLGCAPMVSAQTGYQTLYTNSFPDAGSWCNDCNVDWTWTGDPAYPASLNWVSADLMRQSYPGNGWAGYYSGPKPVGAAVVADGWVEYTYKGRDAIAGGAIGGCFRYNATLGSGYCYSVDYEPCAGASQGCTPGPGVGPFLMVYATADNGDSLFFEYTAYGSITATPGDVFRFEVIGNTLTAKQNGTVLYTKVDSTITRTGTYTFGANAIGATEGGTGYVQFGDLHFGCYREAGTCGLTDGTTPPLPSDKPMIFITT